MHWPVCDLDSAWNQADGEPQRVVDAKRNSSLICSGNN